MREMDCDKSENSTHRRESIYYVRKHFQGGANEYFPNAAKISLNWLNRIKFGWLE